MCATVVRKAAQADLDLECADLRRANMAFFLSHGDTAFPQLRAKGEKDRQPINDLELV